VNLVPFDSDALKIASKVNFTNESPVFVDESLGFVGFRGKQLRQPPPPRKLNDFASKADLEYKRFSSSLRFDNLKPACMGTPFK
jgi:hypothetical protein